MQYSIFGSILTIGAMIGAIVSGRIADYAGRRIVSFANFVCFSKAWLPHLILNCMNVIELRLWAILHFAEQAMGFAEVFCVLGWLAISFSKVYH